MHQQAAAIGDVLARHVFDVTLERVHVGHAGVRLRRQRQRQVARFGERPLVAADLARHRGARALRPPDEIPLLRRELVEDGGRGRTDRGPGERPLHGPRSHRRPKEIARRHDAFERLARQRAFALQRHVDAEVRTPIRRDQERPVHRLLIRHLVVQPGTGNLTRLDLLGRLRLRLVALEHGSHRVVAERALCRQRRRPLGAAPVVDRDRALVDDAVLAVAQLK